ncbi:MAG: transporter substrate-binding domain-containing protein [bacterium]
MRGGPFILLIVICVSFLPACRDCNGPWQDGPDTYQETGDLDSLLDRGRLRIIVPSGYINEALPRNAPPPDYRQDMARKFAESAGLEPEFVYVSHYNELLEYLLSGKGDLVAANLTVTPARREKAAFTQPYLLVRELVVCRKDDDIRRKKHLAGREFAVRRSSSYWHTLKELQEQYPDITVTEVPEAYDTIEIIDMVALGKYELTVADSNIVDKVLTYRDDIKAPLALTEERPVAWAVRPSANKLLAELDSFLDEQKLDYLSGGTYKDDLAGLKNRRLLRVLTRNNSATYFMWRNELVGFEYELSRKFARKNDMKVMMVVPPAYEDLVAWLKKGKGDMIAASMTLTERRKQLPGVSFSVPYNFVDEVVVARPGDTVQELSDLAGRTLVVRERSSYWDTLVALQENKDPGFEIKPAPPDMETEEIINRVAKGKFDLTVADRHILNIELSYRDDVKAAFTLKKDVPHAWAVRAENKELLKAVNNFLERTKNTVYYHVVRNKYFKHERYMKKHTEDRYRSGEDLSPYDDIVKKYAEKYAFDWKLIVAQMFQESKFKTRARSWAGARGLMQIMPRTARELVLWNIHRPEDNIHAGVKYMSRMRSRFDSRLPLEVRNNFALASYNAGYGHVNDARKLAQSLKMEPDKWFNNVEKAMLLLSRHRYYRHARFGYVRGREPVNYVREIRNRHAAYIRMIEKKNREENTAPSPDPR